jgi:hypothetical protein
VVVSAETDAKPLTTAEVESWVRCGADLDGLDRILATTRELEKLEEGLKLWHGLPPDERAMVAIENAGKMWRGAVAERDSAIARAEKAERERDEARAETEKALDQYGHAESGRIIALGVLVDLRNAHELRDDAPTVSDAMNAANRLLSAERPEGQDHIIHANGKTLAGAWLLERKALANAEADLELARARVAELEKALLDACCEKITHGHTTTLLVTAKKLEVPGIKKLCIDAEQIRSEAKTLVAALETALRRIVTGYEVEDEDFGAQVYDIAKTALSALAKAKGGKS